jgi:hypothetical protein
MIGPVVVRDRHAPRRALDPTAARNRLRAIVAMSDAIIGAEGMDVAAERSSVRHAQQ